MNYGNIHGFLLRQNKIVNSVLHRFLFNKNAVRNIINHNKLVSLLRSFNCSNLIFKRTKFIYLFSYLSNSFTTDEKLSILFHHYNFLNNLFAPVALSQLFKTGIECYSENNGLDTYNIILKPSGVLEFEGSLSLYFQMNDVKLATLSFSVAPGKLFNYTDENVFYIACLQQHKPKIDQINIAEKHFNEVKVANILLEVLEALGSIFDIKKLIGVSSANQLTASTNNYTVAYQSIYDEFWIKHNGIFDGQNYIIQLPIPHKPISSIKQTHRNRTLKKRKKLHEIRVKMLENLFLLSAKSNHPNN